MSDNNSPDEQFWDIADSFIALANQHQAQVGPHRTSACLLYAASRYNAFVVADAAETQVDMMRDRDAARAYFIDQYTKMLDENLNDWVENFSGYTGRR
ncbi:DUF3144 domain-containing protein [Asticcacaulis sp. YBE204]|uniref:DUF3144 domain-containing protein n=1 Tax=Asticcacaulis sp. YBE204 TaxID=1282363 RepID=UPI0003C3B366|nr:DUF3144 domain-containing protein [Asticcacaulis sp. YBE204]ESQ77954.1 hypothetical protein AEYBE204_15780 [Asticcacaulis sp. YBE204]